MTALKQSIEKAKAQRQGMIVATGKVKRAEPAAAENPAAKVKASAGKKRA